MSTGRLLAFAATAFVVIAIPGPGVLFVIGRALSDGRRAALFSVLGNAAGEYVQVVAIAFGVGAVVQKSVAAFTVLKLLGGCYLIYLGVKTVRHRGELVDAFAAPHERGTARVAFRQGLAVGATNPKTVIFLAAILPQFVSRGTIGVPQQILLLGLVFAVIAVASDTLWAFAAGMLRSWFGRSPRRLELIGGGGGLGIAAVGIGFLLTGRKN